MKYTHSDSAPIAVANQEITTPDARGRDAAGSDAARFDAATFDDRGFDARGFDDRGPNHEMMGQEMIGQDHEMIGAKERSRAFPGANSARSIPVPSFSVSSFSTAEGASAI